MKSIAILGSTGSIGTQTLEAVDFLNDIKVSALTAGGNIELLERQARKYKPSVVAVADLSKAADLKLRLADTDIEVVSGQEGICYAATLDEVDMVVAAIVGIAGLSPVYDAICAGKDIALANKETLVTAGDIIMPLAREKGVGMLPVDSEHHAIFQCITEKKNIKNLIITASGGSFFGKTPQELENVTVEDALNHPNWSMGRKITIDSATLMNKALEVIEAHHLFNVDYDRIKVVVHRESIVHSMVEYTDNSVLAQMATPDMRLPIQAALTYPEMAEGIAKPLDLSKICTLSFYEPDRKTFPALDLGLYAGKTGGSMPVVFNAANEAAVQMFLDGKIRFMEIVQLVEKAMEKHTVIPNPTIKEISEIDKKIRGDLNC
ncbi:MAG: 1-deoxy-D-xylulose-5-phosphate reductoisomerase [Eubacteriales bacterium]|nr:1-deoxy-D-xylulose-5-phosphate reductoisomerase [Eubacteriales bacterium]